MPLSLATLTRLESILRGDRLANLFCSFGVREIPQAVGCHLNRNQGPSASLSVGLLLGRADQSGQLSFSRKI